MLNFGLRFPNILFQSITYGLVGLKVEIEAVFPQTCFVPTDEFEVSGFEDVSPPRGMSLVLFQPMSMRLVGLKTVVR